MSKKIYFSMTTHPNMNYDRAVKSVIWAEFPKFYRLYLNYVKDHPEVRSHMQLPPQTLLSLKQCAPDVLELALELQRAGLIRFMGTFFSESIAQCQDGMSALEAAELGCAVASAELGCALEGFFLQEIAYTPQLPYIINRLGVQWTIIKDWEESTKPFWAEGLDGSRCIAVPMIEGPLRERIKANPDTLADNSLIITHCDMEFPSAIKGMHQLERFLREEAGFSTEWCFVSDYLKKVPIDTVKKPTPCTNKAEGTSASPSFSRWCADHLSMDLHACALSAMEARRTATICCFGKPFGPNPAGLTRRERPYTTWDVEGPGDYPELARECLKDSQGRVSPFRDMAMLIAWASNSDGRGWFPLLERRFERIDSYHEAEVVADALTRSSLANPAVQVSGSGFHVINPHGGSVPFWHCVDLPEPVSLLDSDDRDVVKMIRRNGNRWEHACRLVPGAYTAGSLRYAPAQQDTAEPIPGNRIVRGTQDLSFSDGVLTVSRSAGPDMTLSLDPFRIYVKAIDTELRDPRPENDWSCQVIPGEFPRLIASRQLDYHIHFRAEYTLDDGMIFADWRFWFTSPLLIDSLDHFDAGGPKTDFTPGGICASLHTGSPGSVWYDCPFGVVRHPNEQLSFVAPLTHAFLAPATGSGAIALVTRSGSQSFKVHGKEGMLGICMGKSITSGGRRKLGFRVGNTIDDYEHITDWYKEFFYGELQHRFVLVPQDNEWQRAALPNVCRALATGPRVLAAGNLRPVNQRIAELSPANVRLAGADPDTGRVVLAEMSGLAGDYHLRLGDSEWRGSISPFGITELHV